MQRLLDYCTEFAKERHFKWGVQKCEVLFSGVKVPPPPLKLQGEPLRICTSFNYLGVVFNWKGIDTNACVSKIGNSIERAALALISMGVRSRQDDKACRRNNFFIKAGSQSVGFILRDGFPIRYIGEGSIS